MERPKGARGDDNGAATRAERAARGRAAAVAVRRRRGRGRVRVRGEERTRGVLDAAAEERVQPFETSEPPSRRRAAADDERDDDDDDGEDDDDDATAAAADDDDDVVHHDDNKPSGSCLKAQTNEKPFKGIEKYSKGFKEVSKKTFSAF